MRRYLSAEKRTIDDVGRPLSHEPGTRVYDAKTKFGPWACLSQESFDAIGIGIGEGLGQCYVRTADGYLVKQENTNA